MAEERQDFLTRHFGAVVTALVTLAGLGFGFWQFIQQDARAERDSRLALSRFVIEHYDALFDEDDALRRARMRAVMATSFPPELVARFEDAQRGQVTAILPAQETASALRRVADGLADIPPRPVPPTDGALPPGGGPAPPLRRTVPPALPATAFIQFTDEADSAVARALQNALQGAGVRAPGIEWVSAGPDRGEVRYFHPQDADLAARALALMRETLGPEAPLRDAPVFLGERYSNVPEGVVELWLPSIGG